MKNSQHDGTLALLKKYGIPVTRENYLQLAFAGNPPDELDGEVEAELEEIFREYDESLLEAMGIGGTLDVDDEDTLTMEQLGDAAIQTIQQMSPEEKAEVRKPLDDAFKGRKQ